MNSPAGPAKALPRRHDKLAAAAAAALAAMLAMSVAAPVGLAPAGQLAAAQAAPVIHMQDTTSSSGQNIWSGRPVHAEYVTPSSVLVGKQIDTIVLKLKKSGSPTGNAEIGVFNSDLSVKKLFATKDVSTLTTSYADYEFTLTGSPYTIAAGDRIGIKYSTGTSATNISIMRDTDPADPFDGANSYHTYYTSAWYTFTSTDLTMTLKLVNPGSGGGGGGGTGTFSDQVFEDGLTDPTSMAFAPDGRLFVAEKGGTLRVIKNGALLSQPFLTVPVSTQGERGLIGVAIDPNFATNKYVYVHYTTGTDPIHNKVSRFTASSSNPDVAAAGSELTIIDLDILDGAYHNAGALHFGPDGKLYIAAGDNGHSTDAQKVTTRLGKILRINADGTIPADNPFYNAAGAKKEVWALGLRNPFTFAFSQDSRMYINDVGKDAAEEVNEGTAGGNYGWPTCEGPCGNSNFIDPLYSYQHPDTGEGRSIAGGAFYHAAQFPAEYQGSYFFGDYVANFIKRLPSGSSNQPVDFLSNTPTPVDIDVGPADGSLYYLSYQNGEVRKVQYSGGAGNGIPDAAASANPTFGAPPLAVNFDGSKSTDPDGDPLTYSWDFGDGTPAGSGVTASHTYGSAGQYTATLTVSDGSGGQDAATVGITVGNPPAGTIDEPAQGTKYSAGDTISFSGSAADVEDGADMPASAFHWEVLLHHNTHTHPFEIFAGTKSGSFTIPQQSETDHDVFYRIYLTVTDSSGLQHKSTRDLLPNKSTITLASNVPGIQVNLDGQPQATPASVRGVVGITRTLDAPLTQTVNGQAYQFQSWSDGGAATHTIDTPAADTTYTANYVPASSSGPATHMQDTTASSGQNIWSGRPVHAEYVTPASSLVGKQINSITVTLKKSGSPTGTAEIGVINPDLSMKSVFATLDVSTLTTSYKSYEFKSPPGSLYTIAAGDRIGVKYTAGTSTTNISIMRDTDPADPFDGANSYHTYYTTSWSSFTSTDLTMTLKQDS